jgi:3',5'-cyclic AMP phosphodiesterase CpdA
MKHRSFLLESSACILTALSLLLVTQFSIAQKFVIPVLPDTQGEINYQPEMFTSQMEWLASHRDSLRIPIVLHVGDVVDFNNPVQYQRASDGFSILDKARVPYAITLGNHDTNAVGENSGSAAPGNTNENLRTTSRFNSYFPTSRFILQKDRFEKNKSDNATYTFKAGGLNWLVITLEFCPRQGAVNWANQVLNNYPNHNAIILTHFFLTASGEISPNNAGYGDLTLQSVYDQLIKKHPNVLLVLSGHNDNTAWRDDIGEKGNHIYQILQDYQFENYGNGLIRLLEIDPEAGTISARMYSPFLKKTLEDNSRFTFQNVKFIPTK